MEVSVRVLTVFVCQYSSTSPLVGAISRSYARAIAKARPQVVRSTSIHLSAKPASSTGLLTCILLFLFLAGFICIEGSRRDCDNWWRQIRVLTWQRISLIDTETLQEEGKVPAFDSFDEHSDRSAVFSLLHNKSCDGILKNFLGICAKPEQGK